MKLFLLFSILLLRLLEIQSENGNDRGKINGKDKVRVKVLNYILPHWKGEEQRREIPCVENVQCDWYTSDNFTELQEQGIRYNLQPYDHKITLGLYHLQSLSEKYKVLAPRPCQLQANITMYESEECYHRFRHLYDPAMLSFDANTTMHPKSDVQRVDFTAYLGNFLPLKSFSSLINAGVYIASDCHEYETNRLNRDSLVVTIRNAGLRVDGVGKCLHSPDLPPEILAIEADKTTYPRHISKRHIVNRYAFLMAFENTIEDGYVSEKAFDALIAGMYNDILYRSFFVVTRDGTGSVPVYLGDSKHLKYLMPDPKSVIFVDDFENVTQLVHYLQYLLRNETAYEEHRAWRKNFDYWKYIQHKPILHTNVWCRICQWTAEQYWRVTKGIIPHKVSNRQCEQSNDLLSSDPSQQKKEPVKGHRKDRDRWSRHRPHAQQPNRIDRSLTG